MAELDDITKGYQALSSSYVDDAGAIAGNTFLNLGNWRDEDIATFVEQVSVPLEGIKRNAASSAIAYHEQVARVTKNVFKAPSLADLDLSMSALRNGANVNQVYGRPFVQMRMALAKGASFTDALDTGSLTATSFARTEVQLSRRQASLFARKANDNIVGYLRTLTGRENCALCYVASTQRYRKGDLLPIHPACDCGEMPIYGDTDTGQVIDQQLLDKSHEAVGQRFGIDVGGREPDYRKIMIRDHGELGPMLTVKGQKFTGPNSLKLVGKKMPKPPAIPPVGERVTKIREKADRIDGAQIQADVRKEFLDPKNPIVKTNRKNVTFVQVGPKAEKYLDDVLAVGKEADDELSRRIKERIEKLGPQNFDPKAIKEQIGLAKQRISEITADITGVKYGIETKIRAKWASDGLSINDMEDLQYNGTFRRLYNEQYDLQKPIVAKLEKARDDLMVQVRSLTEELDSGIAPGSKAFDKIMAEEASKLVEEIRGTTLNKPKLIGRGDAIELTERAFNKYPTPWVEKFIETFPEIDVRNVKRGSWLNSERLPRPILSVSKRDARISGQTDGLATAIHEVGHGMEDSVPGLSQMQYAYWQKRAKSDNNKIQGIYSPRSTKEFGNSDEWREKYSGKSYGLGANSNYEIFTTGVESLLAGSGYFGDSTKGVIVDDDFRRFILGVLIGL